MQKTSDFMTTAHFFKRWLLFRTYRHSVWAAGMKAAAFGWVNGARHVTLQATQGIGAWTVRVGLGDCANERLRIGMKRFAVQLLALGNLDNLAQIEYGGAVAKPFNNRKIVRNENVGELKLFL